MRRRWKPLPAVLLLATCSTSSGVALVSSEQITDSTTSTTGQASTPPTSDTPFTLPPSEPPPGSEPPQSSPTTASSPATTPAGTVPADDLPVPDDCVPLPDDAPPLLVTTPEGIVYQVGPGGSQIVAESDGLDAPISTAWRAPGGTMWVALGAGFSIGRLDAGEYIESGSGSVSLQHVGEINEEPVALWIDLAGQFDPGATAGGRVVVEHADGAQDDLGPAWNDLDSVSVGNIGANTVLLTRSAGGEQVFEYVDAQGRPTHADWFDPTDEPAPAGVTRSAVAVSPDGATLLWTETTRNASGEPGALELVIGSTRGPEPQTRATVARPDEVQTTGDFDGRWSVTSLIAGFEPTRTVLVDAAAAEPEPIVPCIPLGSATIDRAGGGGGSEPPTTSSPSSDVPTTSGRQAPPGSSPPGQGEPPIDP